MSIYNQEKDDTAFEIITLPAILVSLFWVAFCFFILGQVIVGAIVNGFSGIIGGFAEIFTGIHNKPLYSQHSLTEALGGVRKRFLSEYPDAVDIGLCHHPKKPNEFAVRVFVKKPCKVQKTLDIVVNQNNVALPVIVEEIGSFDFGKKSG